MGPPGSRAAQGQQGEAYGLLMVGVGTQGQVEEVQLENC
jgi:hypothetical protein